MSPDYTDLRDLSGEKIDDQLNQLLKHHPGKYHSPVFLQILERMELVFVLMLAVLISRSSPPASFCRS